MSGRTVQHAVEHVERAARDFATAVGELKAALHDYRAYDVNSVPPERRVSVEVAALLAWLGLKDVIEANPSLTDLNGAAEFSARWSGRPASPLVVRECEGATHVH